MIAYGRANPGKLSFAIGSSGSAGHLSTELLKRAGNIEYLVVPYKGSAPAYQDLVGGRIDGFIDPILGSTQYAKGGLLKVIAVTSKSRLAALPDVPTVGESVPGYEFYSWYGLWGPAKLPSDVTQRLNAESNKTLATCARSSSRRGCCLRRARSTISRASSARTWRILESSSTKRISLPSNR